MMETPSGRRNSLPAPCESASGSAPSSAASVVIMIGRKRKWHARTIDSSGDSPSTRSVSSAKSIIMIAFFLTMPISSTMPIRATIDMSSRNSISASSAPTPAEGSVVSTVKGCAKLS